jgi:hypothetical protein
VGVVPIHGRGTSYAGVRGRGLLPGSEEVVWTVLAAGSTGPDRGEPVVSADEGVAVIILGVVLLIIGFIAHVPIIWTLGIIAVVVGAILALLGAGGRAVGGRRHYY